MKEYRVEAASNERIEVSGFANCWKRGSADKQRLDRIILSFICDIKLSFRIDGRVFGGILWFWRKERQLYWWMRMLWCSGRWRLVSKGSFVKYRLVT